MYIYPKRTIFSNLTPIQIFSLIENSGQFIMKIEKERFTVRERRIFSNNAFVPSITGVVDEQKDNTIIDVVFEISKRDKVVFGFFLLSIFLLSLLLGFFSSDIILAMTLICFGFVICAVFVVLYVRNCSRAFKKIIRLLKSVN